jgi:hypothetical protein
LILDQTIRSLEIKAPTQHEAIKPTNMYLEDGVLITPLDASSRNHVQQRCRRDIFFILDTLKSNTILPAPGF